MLVSVIVTTYNWPQALNMVLLALAKQQDFKFEVIVADDGSRVETKNLISLHSKNYPVSLQHVWQEDDGFRAAMIRNKAIAAAKGEYIVFIDGDCIVQPDFIRRHKYLAEAGCFVAGNRILLQQDFSEAVLSQRMEVNLWSWKRLLQARLSGNINQFIPLIKLPLWKLRNLAPMRWQGVKTCNLGVWKQDLLAVNGFDERYTGWGFEDSDLVLRLQAHQIWRKSGKFAVPVLHIWHPEQDRSNAEHNKAMLDELLQLRNIRAAQGVGQYL